MKKLVSGCGAVTLALILTICSSFTAFASCPINSSTSESASAEAREYYNLLPQGVKDMFETKGWKIEISDLVAVNYYGSIYGGFSLEGYIAGYTDSEAKEIVLADTDTGAALNHEMGHFFDYNVGMVSASQEFAKIFKAEVSSFDKGNNTYSYTDASEFFAEAFREYVECAGYLKKTCPQTYAFIDDLVADYGGTTTLGVKEYTRCKSHTAEAITREAAGILNKLFGG